MGKEEWYAARSFAATVTKPGDRIDADKGLMEFNRRARRPLTKAEREARHRAEAEKLAAVLGAGGKTPGGRERKKGQVRRWTRDADGVVRDERGEVVEGY